MIIFGHFSRFLASFKISFSSLQHPTYKLHGGYRILYEHCNLFPLTTVLGFYVITVIYSTYPLLNCALLDLLKLFFAFLNFVVKQFSAAGGFDLLLIELLKQRPQVRLVRLLKR